LELDIRVGGFIVDGIPGVERLSCYIFKGRKAAGLRWRKLIHHVELGPSLSYGGIQWCDEGIFF
jgi:hypothetical protein